MKLYYIRTCASCVKLKKLLDSLKIKVELVNIQTLDGGEESRELDIRAVPTLINEGRRMVGAVTKEQLEDFV